MMLIIFLLLLFHRSSGKIEVNDVEVSLGRVLNFIDHNINKFGFDGIFGVVLAQSQLLKMLNLKIPTKLLKDVEYFIKKCQIIFIKAQSFLPKYPPYMLTFKNEILNTKKWLNTLPDNLTYGEIIDLGFYQNWTEAKILNNKQANYKGVRSDICIQELLYLSRNATGSPSKFCKEMMLNTSRVDTGYLLTHRLLYIQIKRLQGCVVPGDKLTIKEYTNIFCSYIYKEINTSQSLDYPYHDIFLEQVVLCGMEGYLEFLNKHWLKQILKWQNYHGCYESVKKSIVKRTSKIVRYGCSDHSTGLGAAALALYLKTLVIKKINV